MNIIVPITATNMDEALRDIDSASKVADIIELRLDYMEQTPDLELLIRSTKLPILATNRSKEEGGHFKGDEIRRLALLQHAIDCGAAYVDIELNHYHPLDLQSAKLILSYHDFKHTPLDIGSIYKKMKEYSPHIIKIATQANTKQDSLRMLNLVSKADKPMIGICMGELGVITRVYGSYYGAFATFASLGAGKESAPGQISAYKLRSIGKALGMIK